MSNIRGAKKEIVFVLTSSCLWCEKEIPLYKAIKGKLLCSKTCLREVNKHGGEYDMSEVVTYRKRGEK